MYTMMLRYALKTVRTRKAGFLGAFLAQPMTPVGTGGPYRLRARLGVRRAHPALRSHAPRPAP